MCAISVPIPPAPMIATRSPTSACGSSASNSSAYDSTCGSSAPSIGTHARRHASRHDHRVIRRQLVCIDPPVEHELDAEPRQLILEVASREPEVLLAGDPLCHPELPAELLSRLEQRDREPACGE